VQWKTYVACQWHPHRMGWKWWVRMILFDITPSVMYIVAYKGLVQTKCPKTTQGSCWGSPNMSQSNHAPSQHWNRGCDYGGGCQLGVGRPRMDGSLFLTV
jgi:hypothetical protein